MKKEKGFIVFYGVNGVGKSTQVSRLDKALTGVHVTGFGNLRSASTKFPKYDLAPTGPLLNGYLREGNPNNLTPREAQIIYAMNRTHFESTLESLLKNHHFVVSEDYIGTSLAWGMATGVDKDFLEFLNAHLIKPDLCILLDGMPFTGSVEKGHKHETRPDLIIKVRKIHQKLASELGWSIVDANQPEDKVTADIWKIVEETFNL